MRFVLKELALDQETAVGHHYDPQALDLNFNDFRYERDLRFVGKAVKSETLLVLSGELSSAIEQTCSRCLEKISRDWREPLNLVYETQGKKEIDSTPEVREIMILARPQRFLCRESCKSLCPMCGQNLNRGTCSCTPPSPASPFDRLKDIAK